MAMSEKEDPLLIPRHLVVWWMDECKKAQAQVERLSKAGDAMAFHYHQLELRVGNYSFSVKAPSIQAWEKAKEVQS
jgi:hypothetical protein